MQQQRAVAEERRMEENRSLADFDADVQSKIVVRLWVGNSRTGNQ